MESELAVNCLCREFVTARAAMGRFDGWGLQNRAMRGSCAFGSGFLTYGCDKTERMGGMMSEGQMNLVVLSFTAHILGSWPVLGCKCTCDDELFQ